MVTFQHANFTSWWYENCCRQTMIEGYCPLRQELYTSCMEELIRTVQRRTAPLFLLYCMLSRRETVLPTVITFCMFVLPVHILISILARTSHQHKFFRMFPCPLPPLYRCLYILYTASLELATFLLTRVLYTSLDKS